MRKNHNISCDFNFKVNFSNSWPLQFWRSLILIQIYSNTNRSDIVGWNNVLLVYKRNNGTYDLSSMQDACHMNLEIDLAYRGVSWRVVVFLKKFRIFFPFYERGGGEIVAGCVTSYSIFFSDIKAVEKAVALLWNWKSRKVLWYFQAGRKYVRARGLNFCHLSLCFNPLSTHGWPIGIFNCILQRQRLRLFHAKK